MITVYEFSPPLLLGRLERRYQRFLADITLDAGPTITAHCPNTGPMTGVCQPGSRVAVSWHGQGRRKLPYTWDLIEVGGVWVGINTALPNRVLGFGLEQGWFPHWSNLRAIEREVPYGNSRLDFCLTLADRSQVYLEVKNTTWCQGSLALFPDTVTTRGQKHLRQLTQMAQAGIRTALVYFIHRGDCDAFAPGTLRDPEYGRLFQEAVAAGVEVYPYRFQVSPVGISYLGLASLG
ncbi:MAG: DNA/RNA nuclease SfsA [Thermostichales cyanobacterium SZTDM-1c_bins_54]